MFLTLLLIALFDCCGIGWHVTDFVVVLLVVVHFVGSVFDHVIGIIIVPFECFPFSGYCYSEVGSALIVAEIGNWFVACHVACLNSHLGACLNAHPFAYLFVCLGAHHVYLVTHHVALHVACPVSHLVTCSVAYCVTLHVTHYLPVMLHLLLSTLLIDI